MTQKFTAAKALINYQGKILIIKESLEYIEGTMNDKYVVPGGRLQYQEKIKECLIREVKEEVGLEIKIGKPFFVQKTDNNINGKRCLIKRIFFECFSDSDKIKLNNEHKDSEWIFPEKYKDYNLVFNLKEVFQAYLNQRR